MYTNTNIYFLSIFMTYTTALPEYYRSIIIHNIPMQMYSAAFLYVIKYSNMKHNIIYLMNTCYVNSPYTIQTTILQHEYSHGPSE